MATAEAPPGDDAPGHEATAPAVSPEQARSDSERLEPRVTVIVPLSGPHRLEWARQAVASVPLGSPHVAALNIVRSGGPLDWAPEWRQELERHPKVRVIEFPDRLPVGSSLNRCTYTAATRWALLLPDDDAVIPAALEASLERDRKVLEGHEGMIAYGWYYLMGGRYRADHVASRRVSDALRYTPKCCSTLVNVGHFRAIGGFDARYGGYADTVAYVQLAHRFGAWFDSRPVGVYRMHEGQFSVEKHAEGYLPSMEPTARALSALARTESERQRVHQRVREHASDTHSTVPRGLSRIAYRLRSSTSLPTAVEPGHLEPWIAEDR